MADQQSITVRRALISLSDKSGLVALARGLIDCGVELLSTGGTARALAEAGFAVTEIESVTGFPEILGGRVKTLHPRVHGGLLGIRGDARHEDEMRRHGIRPIDLLAVTLYPFEAALARGATADELIETIDIGGPAMIRAAAKNSAAVTVDRRSGRLSRGARGAAPVRRHGAGCLAPGARRQGICPYRRL